VENDPDGVPHAGPDAADAMAQVHAIAALRSLHRPVMDGERHGVALPQRHDLCAALHPRPLLRQDELAAGKVDARRGEKDRNLDREGEIAVQVLVEAVEVA
jgi:hypothetical protein